jgi:hypothetical protein
MTHLVRQMEIDPWPGFPTKFCESPYRESVKPFDPDQHHEKVEARIGQAFHATQVFDGGIPARSRIVCAGRAPSLLYSMLLHERKIQHLTRSRCILSVHSSFIVFDQLALASAISK